VLLGSCVAGVVRPACSLDGAAPSQVGPVPRLPRLAADPNLSERDTGRGSLRGWGMWSRRRVEHCVTLAPILPRCASTRHGGPHSCLNHLIAHRTQGRGDRGCVQARPSHALGATSCRIAALSLVQR
jgi:hypothetical protein